jgi:hypothetical protein
MRRNIKTSGTGDLRQSGSRFPASVRLTTAGKDYHIVQCTYAGMNALTHAHRVLPPEVEIHGHLNQHANRPAVHPRRPE